MTKQNSETKTTEHGPNGKGKTPPVDRAAIDRDLAAEREQATRQDAPADDYLLTLEADDAGNAEAVNRRHGDRFAYTVERGWLQYNGRHWDSDGAAAALRLAIVETLTARRHAAVSAGHREALIAAARPSAKHVRDALYILEAQRTIAGASFDADRHLLNCANGVVDLRTGAIVAHNASQRFTYTLRTEYDPKADRSAWLTFLRGAVKGGDDVINWLQAWLGYCLTGDTRLDEMLYIYGPPRAGKGTLTGALQALLGRPLSSEIAIATLTAKRSGDTQNFDLAPLKPARLIVCEESNNYESLNAGLVKRLTGGNVINAAYKGRDGFTYQPQFKIVQVSNWPVKADPDDAALWARLRVVEFPNSHADDPDKTIRDRMRNDANLRGLLAWLIDGARRFYASGAPGLIAPDAVKHATTKARDDLDTLAMWLAELTDRKPGAWTSNADAYASYSAWCEANGAEPRHLQAFTRTLGGKGYATNQLRRHAGKVQRGISDLALLDV